MTTGMTIQWTLPNGSPIPTDPSTNYLATYSDANGNKVHFIKEVITSTLVDNKKQAKVFKNLVNRMYSELGDIT